MPGKFSTAELYLSSTYFDAQVVPYRSLKVEHISQELAEEKVEILHVSSSWRGKGSRHDCVMLRGRRAQDVLFAKLSAIFTVNVQDTWHHLGITRNYRKKGRDKITGYIELNDVKEDEYEIIFLDAIIRSAHILPPTVHNPRLVVQDLRDPDTYLRLIDVK